MTKKIRDRIRQILADSSVWNADTMIINSSGAVTAIKDADKTLNGPHTERLLVGYVHDILAAAE